MQLTVKMWKAKTFSPIDRRRQMSFFLRLSDANLNYDSVRYIHEEVLRIIRSLSRFFIHAIKNELEIFFMHPTPCSNSMAIAFKATTCAF